MVSEFHKPSQRVGAEDGEVVVLLKPDSAANAQQFANLLGHNLFVGWIIIFHNNPEILLLGMELTKGCQWKVSGVILRVATAAEGLRLCIQYANDCKDAAFAIDVLTEGIFAGKEILSGVMAQNHYLGGAILFGFGPHPPLQKLDVGNFLHGWSGAVQNCVLNLVRATLDGNIADAKLHILTGQLRINGGNIGQAAHGDGIFIGQPFAIELFGGGPFPKGLKMEDPQRVGAQRVDEGRDVGVQPVDRRRNQNHSGDADGDSQNGQAGTQLVLAQRIERHQHGFF